MCLEITQQMVHLWRSPSVMAWGGAEGSLREASLVYSDGKRQAREERTGGMAGESRQES